MGRERMPFCDPRVFDGEGSVFFSIMEGQERECFGCGDGKCNGYAIHS
jgi:hypothetical protein